MSFDERKFSIQFFEFLPEFFYLFLKSFVFLPDFFWVSSQNVLDFVLNCFGFFPENVLILIERYICDLRSFV